MAVSTLTIRPQASSESNSSACNGSYLDTDEDESFSQTRNALKRGIKKFKSLRRAPTPSPVDFTNQARQAPHHTPVRNHHVRAQSSLSLYEKPLPEPPISPDYCPNLPGSLSPPLTPRPPVHLTSPRSDSRASNMDTSTGHPGPAHGTYLLNANGSQSSFASSSKSVEESRAGTTPRTTVMPSTGASTQRRSGDMAQINSSGMHLSGLMCNVHRTTGREPHARVGATTTILGDKLYVFGGRVLSRSNPALTNDLYELDLLRRHWSKIETTGQAPPPRYFHSVCPLGDNKLVCYGGMSPSEVPASQASQGGADSQPEVVVMSDIHIYDTPSRTWTMIPTTDTPQGRYAHCATILPSSAVFSSSNAPLSALHHNPSSGNPNQGTLGVNIDGTGGAEMIIVGGQDSNNHYIEQVSVFNLRSLKWTSTAQLGKSCGAYRSVVAPVPNHLASKIGKTSPVPSQGNPNMSTESKEAGSSMLIYSNYNFLDVKLELQVRSSDGTLSEKPMVGTYTPPGLRFPNGGVIDTHFVVSGTYLTSSKQEYALWALDLRTLSWSRIDAGGNVFSQGSWNRGILWNRRNTFVILGNRKRSLVEDYNHRRLNFSNVCMVELESFGLYDNPRKIAPMSAFISASSPLNSSMIPSSKASHWSAGGRTLSKAAEELGASALAMREIADMDLLAVGGERIPVNSRIISRRWGPYFVQLLREGAATQDGADPSVIRGGLSTSRFEPSHNPRNSSITITPSLDTSNSSNLSRQTTLNDGTSPNSASSHIDNLPHPSDALKPPTPTTLPPSSRPRTLYLPHTHLTLQSLVHYLYTSSLPAPTSPLSTPQILCSLLQLARPYRIEGLAEAIVERLHCILDFRNAAAVFNAAAMAAGGGRGISEGPDVRVASNGERGPTNGYSHNGKDFVISAREQQGGLRINTAFNNLASGMRGRHPMGPSTASEAEETDEEDLQSAASVSSLASSMATDSENDLAGSAGGAGQWKTRGERDVWNGDFSVVIGLQKRGLRGLMEGRRLREAGSGRLATSAGIGPGQGQQAGVLGSFGGGVAAA